MSWGERSFFLSGSREQRPPPWGAIINVSDLQSRFVLCGSVNYLSGKLRFEHLFSNIMIWFG